MQHFHRRMVHQSARLKVNMIPSQKHADPGVLPLSFIGIPAAHLQRRVEGVD